MIRSIGLVLILFSVAVVCAGSAGAQTSSALVTGSELVLLRRGPGTQFPPFATLMRGTTVEVQEVQGQWVRVVTAGGQVGYIKRNYLALHGEKPRNTPARGLTPATPAHALTLTTPAPGATPDAPAATPERAALAAMEERNRQLEAEVQSLRDSLAVAQALNVAPPISVATLAPAAGISAPSDFGELTSSEPVQAELRRLTAVVEELRARLGERTPDPTPLLPPPLGAPVHEPPRAVSPAAVLLGIGGLGVGWIMGSMLGRREERRRRLRIRS